MSPLAPAPPAGQDETNHPAPTLRAALLAWRPPSADGAIHYEVTRFLFVRGLGAVYAVAFLVAAFQLVPLVGHHGILPADQSLERVAEALGGPGSGFLALPSPFWLGLSDGVLRAVSWIGLALAVAVALGFADLPILLVLWALYLSIVHVGQLFWGYGWETMTLETGFLALFLVPLVEPRAWAPRSRASPLVLWLARWLLFRVMFGAGLIKLRGDACWRDLTCLFSHFETTPRAGSGSTATATASPGGATRRGRGGSASGWGAGCGPSPATTRS